MNLAQDHSSHVQPQHQEQHKQGQGFESLVPSADSFSGLLLRSSLPWPQETKPVVCTWVPLITRAAAAGPESRKLPPVHRAGKGQHGLFSSTLTRWVRMTHGAKISHCI